MIDRKLRQTALLVAGCFFMENLDGTIVTTAIPQISDSLGTSTTTVSLVVTAYLLTLAIFIPLSGWLSNRFGARPVFLSAIAIFTLASLGCGLSPTVHWLIAMRAIQGIGGAMMVPVGRMAVLSRTEKQDLIQITAWIIWPGLIAPVIAPVLGGLITTYASWHWMFLINVPLGIIAFIVALRIIDQTETAEIAPLDVPGVVLTCLGLGGLTWGAHLISERDATTRTGILITLTALGVTLLAVRHLLRADAPLLNLRTLAIGTFRDCTVGFFFYALVVWSVPFILPLLFQEVLGWSAVRSGAAVLWVFAGNIGIKPATTWMLNRFGFRANILAASLGVATCIGLFALVRPDTPFPIIAALALISGVFRSIGFTAYNTLAFSDVPKGATMREANALYATTQQLAGALGIVLTTLALSVGHRLEDFLPGTNQEAMYSWAFILMGVAGLLPFILARSIPADAGDALRRKPA